MPQKWYFYMHTLRDVTMMHQLASLLKAPPSFAELSGISPACHLEHESKTSIGCNTRTENDGWYACRLA